MGFGIPASIQAEVTCSFGEITEERKLSTFTRVNQCQYWVFRRSLRFGTSHRGFACCSANSGRINTQNHYWVIIRLWFRKPKCIILSNSREVDEHAGGTNRLHITLCTLRCYVVVFGMRLAYLQLSYPDEKLRVIIEWEPLTLRPTDNSLPLANPFPRKC